MKKCPKCGEEKSLYEFRKNKAQKDGLACWCNTCSKIANKSPRNIEYQKEYRESDKGKNARLKHKYGIDLSDFNRMHAAQNGCCAICNETFVSVRDTHVDHNHITGKIRDLLCRPCNLAVGQVRESPDIARSVAAYLEKHGSS